MKVNIKRLTFLFSFIFMNFLFSESYDPESEVEISRFAPTNMQNNENQTNQCSNCFKARCSCNEDYQRGCLGLPLPVKCGRDFVEGEYLFWKAYTVIPYVNIKKPVTPFNFSDGALNAGQTYSGEMRTVDMAVDSGYRATLGIYFSNCFYGSVQFRYFAANGSDSFKDLGLEQTTVSSNILINFEVPWDLYFLDIYAIGSFSVEGKQRHREKVLDFNFNKLYSSGRYTFTPFIGARFAWVKSDLKIDYLRAPSGVFQISNHIDVNKHMNLGAGLSCGLNGNVDLCCGFGIYTTSSFSVLLGQFQHKIKSEMVNLDSSIERATTTQNYKVTDFQTNFQLGIGFNWGKHFCKCKYYTGLNVGYEVNVWPNFFDNFSNYNSDRDSSFLFLYYKRSLLTHGLNVGLRFDF